MRNSGAPPVIWLLQDGEPLPIDEGPRLMRTGDQARRLVDAGYEVVWWTSRFNHTLKQFRSHSGTWCQLSPRYTLALLDGPGYPKNMSWQRVSHYRALAADFSALCRTFPVPDLILASYPSPELSEAGRQYAVRHRVAFVIDIRDAWPDIFPDYLPAGLRWSLQPLLWHYRQKLGTIVRDADAIVAVSQAMLDWGLGYGKRPKTEFDQVFHIGSRKPALDRRIEVPDAFTPDNPLVCLFATTCGRSYDGEMLVDAAHHLDSVGEHRVRFVISGDGDMRARWLARARGLSRVHFTGWVSHDELQAQFLRAHLGLVLMKGGIARFWLGNKMFEYLAASLAVVNNVSGEPADIVASHALGVNVPRKDAAALAGALRLLADHPRQVGELMQNAGRTFAAEFDRDVLHTRYVDHLASVMRRYALQREGSAA
jgi:glycosyltransferase involved in cell wall biosynthesis